MPDPDGPTMATSSPWSIRRSTPARATTGGSPGYSLTTSTSSRTGAGGAASLDGDRDGHGHDDGTSTRVPALMPAPLTWTRVLLYRPVVTPTRWLVLPVTTSTPNPPPCRASRAFTGTAKHVVGPLGGDVDVHRGLVQGGRGGVLSRVMVTVTVGVELLPLPPDEQGDVAGCCRWRAGAGAGAAAARAGGHVADRLDVPAHRRGAVGQHDRHRVARLDQVLLGHVQVDGDDRGGARGRQHRAAPATAPATPAAPDGRADRRRDRRDPDRTGLEHHLAEQDLAGRRQAERALPTLHRRRRGRRVVVALGQPGAVAEGDQVVGQLAHIGAVGHADVERPVGGDGAVQQRHRLVADRVDRLVLPDDVAHLRQRRCRSCPGSPLWPAATPGWPGHPAAWSGRSRPWPGSGRGHGSRSTGRWPAAGWPGSAGSGPG